VATIEGSLIDSGIFLEILLGQERMELCRAALKEREDNLIVTDFALHSVGLVLLRYKHLDAYREFFRDLAPRLDVRSLPVSEYPVLLDLHERYSLDFDDAYQLATASYFGFSLLTLDSDFIKAKDIVAVSLLR
jgi:predicted nucleic acid-binding protein